MIVLFASISIIIWTYLLALNLSKDTEIYYLQLLCKSEKLLKVEMAKWALDLYDRLYEKRG